MTMKGTGVRLARAGYAVYGIDYEGHGKSSGLQGFIHTFDKIVDDCFDYFSSICEKQENKKKKRFCLGESMGATIALFLHMRMSKYWHGAVLVAPMCQISEDFKPNHVVIKTLDKLAKVLPKWKIVPTHDYIQVAVKDPVKREELRSSPYCYKGKPRLKTAAQLYNASRELEKKLVQITLPFLIVHGQEDVIINPSSSELLYKMASSNDKSFELYPSMWHSIIFGELPENINLVFSDIISWLDKRSYSVHSSDDQEAIAETENGICSH